MCISSCSEVMDTSLLVRKEKFTIPYGLNRPAKKKFIIFVDLFSAPLEGNDLTNMIHIDWSTIKVSDHSLPPI